MFPDFAFVGSIVSMNSISSLSSTPRLLACFKGKYFDSFIFKYLTMIFRNFLRIIGGSVWIWSMMSSSHWGKNFKHRGKFELISQISPYLIGKKNLIISPSFLRCLRCESQSDFSSLINSFHDLQTIWHTSKVCKSRRPIMFSAICCKPWLSTNLS